MFVIAFPPTISNLKARREIHIVLSREHRDDGRDPSLIVRSERFPLGQIKAMPGVLETIPPVELARLLRRHAREDYGYADDKDRASNAYAIEKRRGDVASVFDSSAGLLWITTDLDVGETIMMFPEGE